MADLATAKVAIPKGYADIERIKKSYPTSTIIETDGPREALKMLALGQANVTVLNSGVGNYLILEHGFSNLKLPIYLTPNFPNVIRYFIINYSISFKYLNISNKYKPNGNKNYVIILYLN